MASSITLTSSGYGGRYLELVCTQAKDDANNRSIITWTLSSIGGSVNFYNTGPTTVTINGEQVYYKARVPWEDKVFPAKKGYESGTIYVNHNADGNKTISVSLSTAIYYTSVKTYSSDWTLDSIPRGATILTYPSIFKDTELPTITYENHLGSNATAVDICMTDYTGSVMLALYRPVNKTGTLSYTFTREDVEALIRATSGFTLIGKFFLRTMIGSDGYTDSRYFTFSVTDNADTKPSVSMVLSAINPATMPSALQGTYIQGKTRVKAEITASGKYGASISKYGLSVVDTVSSTENTVTSDAITKPGDVEVIGSAADSRGFTGTASQTISVLEYSKPLVEPCGDESAIRCYRSNGEGKQVGGSTSVWIKAKRSYHSLNGNNKCALQWRRKTVAEVWNDNDHKWKDLIPKTTTNTDEYNALVSGEFVLKESYSVQIRAVDDIGEDDVVNCEIPTQDVALHLGPGGTRVTIGEYCEGEEYTFRSAWKAVFDKGAYGNFYGNLFGGVELKDAADIVTFAKSCGTGLTPFYTMSSTTGVPSSNYSYSSGFVIKRLGTQMTVVLFDYANGDIAIRTCNDDIWGAWRYIHTTTS